MQSRLAQPSHFHDVTTGTFDVEAYVTRAAVDVTSRGLRADGEVPHRKEIARAAYEFRTLGLGYRESSVRPVDDLRHFL